MTWTQSGQSLCSSICVWAETGYNVTWQTAGRKECYCSTVMTEESAGDSSLRCTSRSSPSHDEEEGLVPLKGFSFEATMLLRAVGGLGHAD